MVGLGFDWDEAKAAVNRRKHGVSFEEASTIFYDENALLIADPDHSEEEDRFLLLAARGSSEGCEKSGTASQFASG